MNPVAQRRGAALTAGFALLLVGAPTAAALWLALEPSPERLWDARRLRLLLNSLSLSVGAAAVASVFGIAVALTWQAVPQRFRTAVTLAALLPLILPPFAMAAAYIDLTRPAGLLAKWAQRLGTGGEMPFTHGLPVAIVVLGLHWTPVAALILIAAIRSLPKESLEAAALARGQAAASLRVVLPLIAPGIRTAAITAWLLTWPLFSLPAILQVNALPVESHLLFSAFDDRAGGLRLGFLHALLGIVPAWFAWRSLATAAPAWSRSAQAPPSRPAPVAAHIATALFGAAGIAVPLAALLIRAGSPATLWTTWSGARTETLTSVLLIACTSVAGTALALVLTFFLRRGRTGLLAVALLVPFLLGGPSLAMGIEWLLNRPNAAGLLYDSPAVMAIACLVRYLWVPYLVCACAAATLDAAPEEAARLAGGSWWRTFTGIYAPAMAPAAFASAACLTMLVAHDVDTTLSIAPPGFATLPLRIDGLMHYGPDRLVAGMSLLLIAVQIALLTGGYGVWRRWSTRWTRS